MTKSIVFVALAFMSLSCHSNDLFKEDPETAHPPSPPESESSKPFHETKTSTYEPLLPTELRDGGGPHFYSIALTPYFDPHAERILIQRAEGSGSFVNLSLYDFRDGPEFVDTNIEALHSYSYRTLNPSTEKILQTSKSIQVPQDLVIEGDTFFEELHLKVEVPHTFGRMVLKKGSRLFIGTEILYLKIGTLISSGGVIYAFDPKKSAKNKIKGQQAGTLVMEVKKGLGRLTVSLMGEQGGRDYPLGMPSGDGGNFFLKIENNKEFNLQVDLRPTPGGKPFTLPFKNYHDPRAKLGLTGKPGFYCELDDSFKKENRPGACAYFESLLKKDSP